MAGKASPVRGSLSGEGKAESGKGEVALCIRLRPGPHTDVCATLDSPDCVRLRSTAGACGGGRYDACEAVYRCDHAFGPETTQEQVYAQAVAPISEAVIKGYNGAVIAYGQTGAGKTHTMIGGKGKAQGMAPRAVSAIFTALAQRASWSVEVSVLEIYNERVRDLLAPSGTVAHVDLHEVRTDDQQGQSFRCPDATLWPAKCPDEALAALAEGVRRRETARTDMNHHSSRSHLVFTICVWQCDEEAGARLRSRLHLVDLAGSERLKRSLASLDTSPRHGGGGALSSRQSSKSSPGPSSGSRSARDQRREAGEINRSLSQLALVIQRLTAPGSPQYVPYRDSMLTRLLADSFGGSSRTCLLVACSPLSSDREETRGSLDFGRRAKLVRNKPRINMEVDFEPSAVVKALVARELVQVQVECEALRSERDALLSENVQLQDARRQQEQRLQIPPLPTEAPPDIVKLRCQLEMEALERRQLTDRVAALLAENRSLRLAGEQAAEETARLQSDRADALARLEEQARILHSRWQEDVSRLEQERAAERRRLEEEKALLQQRLREVAGEASQLQEARATLASQLQDERAKLIKRWQEEVQAVREEKAAAVSSLEEEKVALHRRWQEETAQLGEAKAAAVADLEREKANLRRKWQDALEEVRTLQGQQVALEGRLEEDKAAILASFEAEKAACQRATQAEMGQILKEKAVEVARLERERVTLHRRLHEDVSQCDQDRASVAAQLEAEKVALRQKLHDAVAEASALQQEKASLASKLEGDLALAQQRWQADAADQVQEARWARDAQISELQGQLALAERRSRELEAYCRRLEGEAAEKKPEVTTSWQPPPSSGGCSTEVTTSWQPPPSSGGCSTEATSWRPTMSTGGCSTDEASSWRPPITSSGGCSIDEVPTRCPSEPGSGCSTDAAPGPSLVASPPQWCRAPSATLAAAAAVEAACAARSAEAAAGPNMDGKLAQAMPSESGAKEHCLPAMSVLEGRSLNWGHLWSPSRVKADMEPRLQPEGGASEVGLHDEVPRRICLDLEFSN